MLRKVLTAALAALLINLAAAGPARAAQAKSSAEADVFREKVVKFGRGTRVEVRLKDGPKLRGRLGEADDEGFMLVDSKGARTRVAYEGVKSLKRDGEFGTTSDIRGALVGVGLIGGIILLGVYAASQTR